jgi:hypothetical protein
VRGEWAGQEVAPPEIAHLPLEVLELRVVFDPLRHDLDPKVLAELNEAVDHGTGLRGPCESAGERPIDFQCVDEELLRVAERRVAGAEVMNGDTYANSFERP